MSVECYALVTFKGELTDFEKSYNDSMREQGLKGARLAIATPIIKLCRIRLVQGKGKNGSVPKPRWEVVEECEEYNSDEDNHPNYSDRSITYEGLDNQEHRGRLLKEYSNKDIQLMLEKWEIHHLTEEHVFIGKEVRTQIVEINSRTVQLRHIHSLFPECATMPFSIALDYVRDKL